MMKIIVKDKQSWEKAMTFEFDKDGLDPKVAVLYALQSAGFIVAQDATDLMQFIMWLREDCISWNIFEYEEKQIAKMELGFDIEYYDLDTKIKEATEVKDLFN